MNKVKQMEEITQEILACRICKENKIGKAVVGEGSLDAKVMFVGEAPGKQEAETGRPFIGRSGKLLRQTMEGIGLSPEAVYITSVVKYLPAHGTPIPQEILHGRVHLIKQIAIINPQVIVSLGSVASFGIFGEKVAVSQVHGTLREWEGRKVFISYHPAAAIRFAKFKPVFISDFQLLKSLL